MIAINGIEVDEKAVKRLKEKIVLLESRNINTKQLSDQQMVKKIKDMIEEEAQCYSNQ